MELEELELPSELSKLVEHAGFEGVIPIQAETIPLALVGKDVIGQAQTSAEKTAAFGLPMLEKTDPDRHELQGLVIAPTRELAIQTQEELYRSGRDRRVRVQTVYDEADIGRQIRDLKDRSHIVVGTPGCMLNHINRHALKLGIVQTLVLDEADEMLNIGFLEGIERTISQVPDQRRTLFFSATMPPAIKNIGVKFMKSPHHMKIRAKEMTANLIDRYYIRAKEYRRFDIMTRLFDVQTPELTIVFGCTGCRVDGLTRGLEARGHHAKGIHGDLSQQKRMNALRLFRSGHLDVLAATDVTTCKSDISGVTHVYNCDIPQDPESYVHRIGCTGRAGGGGMPVALVTPNEMDYLHATENLTKERMTILRPPTEKETFKGRLGVVAEQIGTKPAGNGLDKYLQTADKLLEEYPAQDLVTLLLKTTAKDPADAVPVKITPERPLLMQKKGYNKNDKHGDGSNHNRRDGGSYHGNESEGGCSKNNNSQEGGGKRHSDKKRGFVICSSNN